jgi:integrase
MLPAFKASGIRRVRLHDLRYTFASQLIEQDAHPKYIQEQLGHSSITMTMDTYGHLFPNRKRSLERTNSLLQSLR